MSGETRKTWIGIDTDILRGSMTGVGNYCFHLIKATIENEVDLRFCGFSRMSWQPMTLSDLETLEQAQGKNPTERNHAFKTSVLREAALSVRKKLEKVSPARQLYRKVRAERFKRMPTNISLDIFHAFKYVPAADLNIPVLPVVYDLSFVRYPDAHPKDRLRQLESLPKIIDRSAIVQTISQFSKAEIIDVYRCSPEKVIVAPPAPARIFRPLGLSATSTDLTPFGLDYKSFLLAVGTLEPRKNLRTLISAYSLLPSATRSHIPLVIVGNAGWGKLDLPADTDRLMSEGSLRFLAAVNDVQLRSLYEGAIGLLFASIYEGFGMPVVEALACGTQVAHSSNSAMDEITGGTALCAPALDVSAWTTIMSTFIDQRAQTGSTSEARILRSRLFDWHRSAVVVKQAYDLIMHAKA